jgi:hypothetical protein
MRNTTLRGGLGLALLGSVVAAVAAITAGPAAASGCSSAPKAFQPFAWSGDSNSYVLTAGGSFESGTPAWSLSGGASIVSGNAPDPFAGSSDGQSLYLPAGASATSACTTNPKIEPIVRLWARSLRGNTHLRVEVLVNGGTYSAGTYTAGTKWAPSAALASGAPDSTNAVQYQVRLTAIDGPVTVDDVYIDPWCSW